MKRAIYPKTKKTMKNIGFLLLLIALIFVVAYVVSSYMQFTTTEITLDDFAGKTFVSSDDLYSLDVSDGKIVFWQETTKTVFTEITYQENVLKLVSGDVTLYFWALSGTTLFSDVYRVYLYEM